MKLSDKTLQVLKSFSSINQSILIHPGSTLSTIAPSQKVIAKATVQEEFDREFAIYDLPRFLGAISLFKDPELTLGQNAVAISDGGRVLNYVYASPETIIAPPVGKTVRLPSEDVHFRLTEDVRRDVTKAAAVLGMPEIAVSGDGSALSVGVAKVADPTAHGFSIPVGETDHRFRLIFVLEAWNKMLPGDYDVTLSLRGLASFTGPADYVVVAEDTSTT